MQFIHPHDKSIHAASHGHLHVQAHEAELQLMVESTTGPQQKKYAAIGTQQIPSTGYSHSGKERRNGNGLEEVIVVVPPPPAAAGTGRPMDHHQEKRTTTSPVTSFRKIRGRSDQARWRGAPIEEQDQKQEQQHHRHRVQFTSSSSDNNVYGAGRRPSDSSISSMNHPPSHPSSPSTSSSRHQFFLSSQHQNHDSSNGTSSDAGSVQSAPGRHHHAVPPSSSSMFAAGGNRHRQQQQEYGNGGSRVVPPSISAIQGSKNDMAMMKGVVSARDTQIQQRPTTKAPTHQQPNKQHIRQTRNVIDDLKKAAYQNPEKRVVALTTACGTFDHPDEARHDMEMQLGAVNALTKVLSVTVGDIEKGTATPPRPLHAGGKKYDVDSMIARLVAVALEMIFRGASHAAVSAIFTTKTGWSQLTPILRVMELAEEGSLQHADVTIANLSKLLLYVSRVQHLRLPLAQQHGVLEFLSRISTSILNADGRVVRLRTLTNLVYEDENKTTVLQRISLLDSVIQISHLDLDPTARGYASTVLMDLASSTNNQVEMAKNEKLLGALVKLASVEKVASTRESAITAIQSLAYTKNNRPRLVAFKNGIILEVMKKVLNGDTDEKCRRRAAGALTNLVCDETVEVMGCYNGLLETLAIASSNDISLDVQSRAAMALTKLAAGITVRMKDCYPKCLDSLVVASLKNSSISAVLRVKARDPANRSSMVSHPGILDTLADICLDASNRTESMTLAGTKTIDLLKDKDNAMRAIMHLANDDQNRRRMCTPHLLDALVEGAKLPDDQPLHEEIRNSAIRTIERLATEFENRSTMAHHEGLLVAVAAAVEREANLEAQDSLAIKKKIGILESRSSASTSSPIPLHPQKVHLAKPLLMSLLVSM